MLLYKKPVHFTFIFLIGILLSSCGGKQAVQHLFQKRTPHEAYAHHLKEAKLHETALGKTWIEAGKTALHDSVLIKLPFRETGYFRAEKPSAAAYSFKALRGEKIYIEVTTRTKQDIRLFLDLFEVNGNPRRLEHLAAADTTSLKLEHTVTENQVYLVRIQPELLQSGSFTVTIQNQPSIAFPVQGKTNNAIQSFWGSDRDGGARRHEGVDIFAAKGTPVLAGTKGIINRVNETPIGGKVVWLTDFEDRQSLYYAHLDKQLVTTGQTVNPGDTLGLVGNTGNAIKTPPHLHFGIYRFGQGAVDPLNFIRENKEKPTELAVNESHFGDWGRTKTKNALLRKLPATKAEKVASLEKNTAFQVLGGSGEWFKIQLPDNTSGYLHKSNFESTTKPIGQFSAKNDTEITEKLTDTPIAALPKNSEAAVLGVFGNYRFVKLADGTLGWVLKG